MVSSLAGICSSEHVVKFAVTKCHFGWFKTHDLLNLTKTERKLAFISHSKQKTLVQRTCCLIER